MTPDGATDRKVVDAVLGGDLAAYRVLVDRESRRVIALCLRILADIDEAQDAAQDTFIRAYTSLGGYRGDGAFGAWVGRIAARIALARLAARPPAAPLASRASAERLAQDPATNPERLALDVEQRGFILEAIRALPAAQRRVVALRFFHELSLDEISAITRTPLGTVKSRLHRGLARLRDRLIVSSAP